MANPSAVLYAQEDLRIEDRPVPEPAAGQVLVEVGAVGICGSDVHYFEHGRIGRYVVDAPMVIGHESAGVIVGLGDGVDSARLGEQVAMEPGVPDRTCEQCLAGRYNLCPNVVFFATPPFDGSISRFVVIDQFFAHPAPAPLTVEQAAMAEPVSVGVWAARKARVGPGDRVLVTGAGPIGLFAAQVARAFGARSVTVTDVSEFRLGVASDLGLGALSASAELDGEFDVLLECSGAPAALRGGMNALAPAGRVVLVGMGADTVSIDVPLVQGRELTISGIFRYANTYPLALSLIASGAVDTDRVVTHRFALDQTELALTLARRDPRSLKAVVLPSA
ncbi:NAD(P)-dependent alcohol dehydrogenase [Lacisediminihabitans profunda]|uniref:NAD(P)-dependent alcohol dehydrogenase n=1 Tax=Lacisediminihabitans profunda TaxID=2594790 RepID=A0A5C8UWB7_9MICO|nr:NAD(P)-dependent alcohol dehydrogenase [Lacisediminihabitans profunda]TXN32346.1 NAD(P)-dependent alcohol dehydrogenase [Lacisediminihabitans profunda]